MRKGLLGIFLWLMFLFWLQAMPLWGQKRNDGRGVDQPSTCEHVKNTLDYVLLDHNEAELGYLILIFRPGFLESSKKFSERRPIAIEKYLRNRDKGLDRLIIAQGRANGDLGKLEIYLFGKLREEIFFRKNTSGYDQCIE